MEEQTDIAFTTDELGHMLSSLIIMLEHAPEPSERNDNDKHIIEAVKSSCFKIVAALELSEDVVYIIESLV